jgi:hypothetical protein
LRLGPTPQIGKNSDWEREDFAYVRNSKIGFFSSVVGVAAIPALWKFASMSPRFMAPELVGAQSQTDRLALFAQLLSVITET